MVTRDSITDSAETFIDALQIAYTTIFESMFLASVFLETNHSIQDTRSLNWAFTNWLRCNDFYGTIPFHRAKIVLVYVSHHFCVWNNTLTLSSSNIVSSSSLGGRSVNSFNSASVMTSNASYLFRVLVVRWFFFLYFLLHSMFPHVYSRPWSLFLLSFATLRYFYVKFWHLKSLD